MAKQKIEGDSKESPNKKPKYVFLVDAVDKNDHNVRYSPGDSADHFDEARLAISLQLGNVGLNK